MLLVINDQAVSVSAATFHPADGKHGDAILLQSSDISKIFEGAVARAVWEQVKHLADAVIEVREEGA